MDYDNDGILDFISGSYDPGDIYLFRGLGNGKYERGRSITDENDVPLVHHPEEFAKFQKGSAKQGGGLTDKKNYEFSEEGIQLRAASFGSWPAMVDWDADGDLDMLIGGFLGSIYLRENIGSREEPLFAGESTAVNIGNKPLKGNGHANPVVADWDSDGLWDLIVGSSDGSVGWYKNVGSKSSPDFNKRQSLVKAAAEHKFLEQNLAPGEEPKPGVRAQICVTDYNGDGLLDLIVGDYSDINWTRELSEQEEQDFEELNKKRTEITSELLEIGNKLYEGKDLSEKQESDLRKENDAVIARYMKLEEDRKSFYAESRPASFVWLYERKTGAENRAFTNLKTDSEPKKNEAVDSSSSDSGPVAISTNLVSAEEPSNYRLEVTLDIQPSWHLYASAPKDSAYYTTKIDLVLPNFVSKVGDWKLPAARPSLKTSGLTLYQGQVIFVQELKLSQPSSNGNIEVEVDYQVCNASQCLPPAKLKSTVKLPIKSE